MSSFYFHILSTLDPCSSPHCSRDSLLYCTGVSSSTCLTHLLAASTHCLCQVSMAQMTSDGLLGEFPLLFLRLILNRGTDHNKRELDTVTTIVTRFQTSMVAATCWRQCNRACKAFMWKHGRCRGFRIVILTPLFHHDPTDPTS